MLTELIHIGLAIGMAAAAVPGADKLQGKKLVITDKPLTVKIKPSFKLAAGLGSAPKPDSKVAITLTLEGVVPPEQRNQVEGVRVFLNKGDATRCTPTDDPHFVTVFAFPATDRQDPYGVNLDLTQAVIALSARGELDTTKPLLVTLVAIPASGVKNLPAAFSVPVGGVSIEASPAK
jgi:hypothetical protein